MHFDFTQFGLHGGPDSGWRLSRASGAEAESEVSLKTWQVVLPGGQQECTLAVACVPDRDSGESTRSGTLLNAHLLDFLAGSGPAPVPVRQVP